MAKADIRRDAIADLLADHLLAEGLNATSLRPLAKAAGLSDRMLIYYFESRDAAIEAGLQRAAERMTAILQERTSSQPLDADRLLDQIKSVVLDPELQPFMALWLELVAQAARNEEPYRSISAEIAAGFLDWTIAQLKSDEADMRATAVSVLAETEGLVLLNAAGLVLKSSD